MNIYIYTHYIYTYLESPKYLYVVFRKMSINSLYHSYIIHNIKSSWITLLYNSCMYVFKYMSVYIYISFIYIYTCVRSSSLPKKPTTKKCCCASVAAPASAVAGASASASGGTVAWKIPSRFLRGPTASVIWHVHPTNRPEVCHREKMFFPHFFRKNPWSLVWKMTRLLFGDAIWEEVLRWISRRVYWWVMVWKVLFKHSSCLLSWNHGKLFAI